MATFIVTGNLPQKALAGYLAKPEDRTAPLGALFEQAGGKLRAFYFTTGAHDFLMIVEAPDAEVVAAALVVIGAAGVAGNLSTCRAWTGAEFRTVIEAAGGLTGAYRHPGV